jgi:SAM-dependent MidA family methyltransferase
MSDLKEIIIEKIRKNGQIPFRDFMDAALYHPGLGYYVSGHKKICTEGDYLTSPALTHLFGEIISRQLTEMWEQMGQKKFTIVEYGAGDGTLCRNILANIKRNKRFFEMLEYISIDKKVGAGLDGDGMPLHKVRSLVSGKQLSGISGCVLSNELLDNFPVHLVEMGHELMEVHIGYENGFYELLLPAGAALNNYFAEQKIVLPEGHRTEVNLQAIEWLKEVSALLKEGFVMTMDYGYTSDAICSPRKKNGSILCYHKQQVNDDPFRDIGEQDITAHVNFSALKLWGDKNDLHCSGLTTQSLFLRSFGAVNDLRKMESEKSPDTGEIEKLMTVIFGLGEKIKLMIHQKGIEKAPLTGLQFQMPV